MNHVWSTIDYSAMSTFILNLSSNLLITIELFWATTDEENKSMGIPSGGRNQGLLVGFVYTGLSSLGPHGGARGAMAPPDFGRTVNPISTRGTDYAHLITTGTPGFSDLPTTLRLP